MANLNPDINNNKSKWKWSKHANYKKKCCQIGFKE